MSECVLEFSCRWWVWQVAFAAALLAGVACFAWRWRVRELSCLTRATGSLMRRAGGAHAPEPLCSPLSGARCAAWELRVYHTGQLWAQYRQAAKFTLGGRQVDLQWFRFPESWPSDVALRVRDRSTPIPPGVLALRDAEVDRSIWFGKALDRHHSIRLEERCLPADGPSVLSAPDAAPAVRLLPGVATLVAAGTPREVEARCRRILAFHRRLAVGSLLAGVAAVAALCRHSQALEQWLR